MTPNGARRPLTRGASRPLPLWQVDKPLRPSAVASASAGPWPLPHWAGAGDCSAHGATRACAGTASRTSQRAPAARLPSSRRPARCPGRSLRSCPALSPRD